MGRFKLAHATCSPVDRKSCGRSRRSPGCRCRSCCGRPTKQSIVFITFLGSFFPILVNTLHGMSLVDPVLVRASHASAPREVSIFREVYFPASLPHIFTGLTVGMGVAWVSLIAAEMISGQFGIGYFTWEAYSLVQYPDIALGMISIGVLGLGSSALIRGVRSSRIMPWSRHLKQEIATAPSERATSKSAISDRATTRLEGPVEAVCDASIHVNPGEFVSIVGPSGCGKSTLLNAVAGFLKPSAGDVTARRRSDRAARRRSRHGVPAILAVPLENGQRERRIRPEDEARRRDQAATAPRARCSASPA